MKNLVFISGTMGIGKTATGRELHKALPKNVFLDGDWCWDMTPFVVTDETKAMVLDNITHLLNNFIACSELQNIIFCWVMHEQSILDEIISRLGKHDCRLYAFSLVSTEQALLKRIAKDVRLGLRDKDSAGRSVIRLGNYMGMDTEKIDVSKISAKQAAKIIAARVLQKTPEE